MIGTVWNQDFFKGWLIDMGHLPGSPTLCLRVRRGGRSFRLSSEGPSVFSDSNWKTVYLDSNLRSAASSISVEVGERNAVAKRLPSFCLKDG